jgi:hypothetical protein
LKIIRGANIVLTALLFGCGFLGERPNDPVLPNDRDSKIIGAWANDSLMIELTFNGSKLISIKCDTSACRKDDFVYRTYNNMLYRDFLINQNCDINRNNCVKIFEGPMNSMEIYEIISNQDTINIENIKYYKKLKI